MCECPGKCVTEREAVEREQAAFEGGARWAYCAVRQTQPLAASAHAIQCEGDRRYPLPKVRRLREWNNRGARYRFNPDKRLFELFLGDAWDTGTDANERAAFILEHIEALADLKANPYEEVGG